jgi:hypothetical protein
MSGTTTLRIHSGHLSCDNGAIGPINVYFDLAKLFDVPALTGNYYGDDRLEIPTEQLAIAEELLQEHSMLYMIEGVHTTWQNVRTDEVRRRLRFH